jgi:hypothetical protein
MNNVHDARFHGAIECAASAGHRVRSSRTHLFGGGTLSLRSRGARCEGKTHHKDHNQKDKKDNVRRHEHLCHHHYSWSCDQIMRMRGVQRGGAGRV